MKKLSIIAFASLIYANTYYTTNHAFTLKENKKLIILEYQKINDTIDIFNIKEDELKSTSFDAIGDMDGVKLKAFYGYKDNLTLFSEIQREDIEYGSGTLINYYLNIGLKYNFFKEDNYFISFDIGAKINKGNNINFSDSNYLASLAKRFFNVKDVKISDNKIGVVKSNGTTEILYLKQRPSIKISDLKDASIYLTLNNEKIFNKLSLNLFATMKYTKIYTEIKANLIPADANTQELLSKYDLYKNLERSETSIDVGFNIVYKAPIVVEFSYLYRKIFRDKDLDYIDYNHIINLNLIKPINQKWFIYLGGKAMYRQFNGEIPYLYNKYSQTTFDHKYGWANIGVGYSF